MLTNNSTKSVEGVEQDTAPLVIMNPFNSSLKIEQIFILDSGAEMSYLRAQAVGKSVSFTSIYGNGELSLGYKSAVTVEMFHINITVVVDSAIDKSILSKQFMEILGLCHYPRIGFVPC